MVNSSFTLPKNHQFEDEDAQVISSLDTTLPPEIQSEETHENHDYDDNDEEDDMGDGSKKALKHYEDYKRMNISQMVIMIGKEEDDSSHENLQESLQLLSAHFHRHFSRYSCTFIHGYLVKSKLDLQRTCQQ